MDCHCLHMLYAGLTEEPWVLLPALWVSTFGVFLKAKFKNNQSALFAMAISKAILVLSIVSFLPILSSIQAAAASTPSITYTVQPGDYLYRIGQKFGVPWQSIAQANTIQPPYTIYPGQVFVIPLSSQKDTIATGNSVYDQFDSYILSSSVNYSYADPMMIKSMVAEESSFNPQAVSQDSPCGIPAGWIDSQSRSFGLMQVTPACMQPQAGTPNLSTDPNSSSWPNSWFNPQYNVARGVQTLSSQLSYMKSAFNGCSSNQYMLMAVGAYNSGTDAVYGCGSWSDRANTYINAVLADYQIFSKMAGGPYPYR